MMGDSRKTKIWSLTFTCNREHLSVSLTETFRTLSEIWPDEGQIQCYEVNDVDERREHEHDLQRPRPLEWKLSVCPKFEAMFLLK